METCSAVDLYRIHSIPIHRLEHLVTKWRILFSFHEESSDDLLVFK